MTLPAGWFTQWAERARECAKGGPNWHTGSHPDEILAAYDLCTRAEMVITKDHVSNLNPAFCDLCALLVDLRSALHQGDETWVHWSGRDRQ